MYPLRAAVDQPTSLVYEAKKFLSNRKNMMKDGYWLPPRKAWLCRLAGLVFLIGAAVMLPVIAFAGLTPGASPGCGGGYGCVWEARPVTLIDSDELQLTDCRCECWSDPKRGCVLRAQAWSA